MIHFQKIIKMYDNFSNFYKINLKEVIRWKITNERVWPDYLLRRDSRVQTDCILDIRENMNL